nr:hypothetical protein [Navicula tsukamotoi]
MNFDFINCKLNDVYFNAGQLTDLQFDNSQLQNVSYSGSLLDNVKIKNSTLEKIRFDGAEVEKETYENGILIINRIPINDYSSFLKEITLSELGNFTNSVFITPRILISRSYYLLLLTLVGLILMCSISY